MTDREERAGEIERVQFPNVLAGPAFDSVDSPMIAEHSRGQGVEET